MNRALPVRGQQLTRSLRVLLINAYVNCARGGGEPGNEATRLACSSHTTGKWQSTAGECQITYMCNYDCHVHAAICCVAVNTYQFHVHTLFAAPHLLTGQNKYMYIRRSVPDPLFFLRGWYQK